MYSQVNNFHNSNCNFNESIFFNANKPQEICASIWLGPYNSLLNEFDNSSFLNDQNIKIIINCGNTVKFINLIESNEMNIQLSSDIIILNLDPSFDINESTNQALISSFNSKFNKILQNYLSFFYLNNPQSSNLIHKLPPKCSMNIDSPILYGSNLKLQFFKLIRLISLFKLINDKIQILVISEDGNLNLSTGLIIAFLMDIYKYNIENSFKLIKSRRPCINDLKLNYYDDLLIIENLKKFYVENIEIKSKNPNYLKTKGFLKRSMNDDDHEHEQQQQQQQQQQQAKQSLIDEILVGGDRKRRLN
ncbi:unnamed protein product [Candida verbasci]|uniref:Uncharacterized protein n=1 Tax=Candida verbasci TaxID=1227364 RepID=A0A9W4X991_9ASCO|nr:unnamed protein product [Candida verbasci]